MLRFFILSIVFCFLQNSSISQVCGIERGTFAQKEEFSAHARGGILMIPVVVHVVYDQNALEQNISDEQIFSQIDVLNQDFRKKNNQSNLPQAFKNVAADVEIEFFLAKIDPKGKNTNGITRTATSSKSVWQEKAFLNGVQKQKVYYSNIEGENAWDTKKYLNIWVCAMPSGKSGYATFPNQTLTTQDDGVVIDYRFFGTKGVAASNQPFHLGRTATHEIGHYFNLQHLWGDSISNDDCMADDEVQDTPKQTGPIAGCPNAAVMQCGQSVMYQNFMNYSNDDCMSIFTEGQKARMLSVLASTRKDLISNNIATTETSQATDFQAFPNPANQFITLVTAKECQYNIINMQGQIVMTGNLDAGLNQLETAELQAGIYQIGIVIDHIRIIKKINIIH